jgi:hypothetical protein
MRACFILAGLALTSSSYIPATTVELGSPTHAGNMATYVCQGLYSRDPSTAVYVIGDDTDRKWLNFTGGSAPKTTTQPDFEKRCLTDFPRYIRFNWTSQKELMPNIVTLAAVLDAVPLEDGAPTAGATMVFDAINEWSGFTELEATSYMFDNHANKTTGLAKLNPGWRWDNKVEDQLKPKLIGGTDLKLVDFIVKQRLFNFFLKNGCIKDTDEHALLERMLSDKRSSGWPRPIVVYGYDNSHPLFGGDVYEAETTCSKEHNMGQVASEGTTNLAFFSSRPPIATPLVQIADPPLAFNKSKSYVAIVVGDGDNVQYVQHSRFSWMQDRVNRCKAAGGPSNKTGCFPLLWSLNPHLTRIAPDWMRWYYNIAKTSGADWFVLPPSGDTYSYPSQQQKGDQATFVARTEEDCRLMNTSGSTTWETAGTWEGGIKSYYPRYATNGIVTSFYAVNVPYDLPVTAFGEHEHYKLLGGTSTSDPIVLFKPQEWRGEHCADGKGVPPFGKYSCPTAEEMAARLNDYAPGTVSAIYMTSDGGAHLDTLYKLVPLLGEHVVVTNQNNLGRMAQVAAKGR